MNKKDNSTTYPQLERWWQSTLGQLVMQVEMEQLIKVFPEIFGYHLLLLGTTSQFKMVEYSVIPYQSVINPFLKDKSHAKTITAQWNHLPILNNSVDVIIAPHCIEFADNGLDLLDEMHRVLIPEGRIILFGFNPFSLWRFKGLLSRAKAAPWCCRFTGINPVRRHLKRLGFTIEKEDYFLFQPPMKNINTMEKLGFLNKLGKVGLKGLSGIYFIEAQKKVAGVRTLHLHHAKVKKVKARQAAASSARVSEKNIS